MPAIQQRDGHELQHAEVQRSLMAEFAQKSAALEAKTKAARAIELSPNDPLMFYNAACFYSSLGDKRLALQSFKNAISSGYGFFEWIKRDPDLDNIRNEPEYIELMKGK